MSEYKEYIVKVYEDRTEWRNKKEQLHREGGPAIEYLNGDKEWYKNGFAHREDGPAVEFADGGKEWWLNGKLHREDGPAVEYSDRDKLWYKNGKYHREDGPAIEWSNGDKSWHINGKQLTEEEFKARTKPCSIRDKIIEMDGKRYRLIEEK